jgi:hypothetical protein
MSTMSGFNKITRTQPQSVVSQRVHHPTGGQMIDTRIANESTPRKSLDEMEGLSYNIINAGKKNTRFVTSSPSSSIRYVTPKRVFEEDEDSTSLLNAPNKKRTVEVDRETTHLIQRRLNEDDFQSSQDGFRRQTPPRSASYEFEAEESGFHANQLGMYEMDRTSSQRDFVSSNVTPRRMSADEPPPDAEASQEEKGKQGYERIKQPSISMGGFYLPEPPKKALLQNYHWQIGKQTSQYHLVLGYNTQFKPKNAVDMTTGEKGDTRWRVLRIENRWKENAPFVEIPWKYGIPLAKAVIAGHDTAAKEAAEIQHLEEQQN